MPPPAVATKQDSLEKLSVPAVTVVAQPPIVAAVVATQPVVQQPQVIQPQLFSKPMPKAAAPSSPPMGSTTQPYANRVPQQRIQPKVMVSDMFSGSDFSPIQFVEDLTRVLVNDQMRSDGSIKFEPSDFNTLFLTTQKQLTDLEVNVDRKLDDLADTCNDYSRDYKVKLQDLLGTYQETFQHFRKLEKGVNTIGAQAVHFGDELDSVAQQRNKAQSALSLINYLLELSNPESTQRSDIFTNSERIHELANLVKKLSSVSEDIKEIAILDKGKSETESLSNTLENDLINQFGRAQDKNDLEKMKQCATTLYNFNGGARCRSTYVQKLRMFFDPHSMARDELMANDVSKRIMKNNTIVKDRRFKLFFKGILDEIKEEQKVIKSVFINQTSAMAMLIVRVFEQRTKKKLVEPMSSFGISGIDFGSLLSSIFCTYQDEYVNRELASLNDILAGLLEGESDNNQLLQAMSSLEVKICKALEMSLTTMIALLDKTLLGQKRDDYTGEDYDNSVTPTCNAVLKLLNTLIDLARNCLQGKNFSIFVEELGQRSQFAFINHFKKFKIGQIGALKLIKDLTNYRDCAKQFKSHKVDDAFEILFEISKLHLVNPENFKSVIEGGALSRAIATVDLPMEMPLATATATAADAAVDVAVATKVEPSPQSYEDEICPEIRTVWYTDIKEKVDKMYGLTNSKQIAADKMHLR
eukprot:gene16642-19773_t